MHLQSVRELLHAELDAQGVRLLEGLVLGVEGLELGGVRGGGGEDFLAGRVGVGLGGGLGGGLLGLDGFLLLFEPGCG